MGEMVTDIALLARIENILRTTGHAEVADALAGAGASLARPRTLVDALRAIKRTTLMATDPVRALQHIVRLCIDAGINEHLDGLCAPNDKLTHGGPPPLREASGSRL